VQETPVITNVPVGMRPALLSISITCRNLKYVPSIYRAAAVI